MDEKRMNRYAGKARIGVIASLAVAALAIVGLHRSSGRAYSQPPTPVLFVTDKCSQAVTAYPITSNGDVPPLAPAPTGLSEPQFVATDASGNIYATNRCSNTITIYAEGSNGNTAPIAIIGGPNTGVNDPQGIALDSSGNIYLANLGSASVLVFPALGGSTGLLNESPTATISGNNTGLSLPVGIALDSSATIYVADLSGSRVLVYSQLGSSTGLLDESPVATISGSKTGLALPFGIAVDSTGNIYAADPTAASVFVYPPLGSSTGLLNEVPIATISGSKTGLVGPHSVALDSSGNIYVADSSAAKVFVYPPLATSTGLPNESPTITIGGSNTGLIQPSGIGLDSSGNIYVTDSVAASVFVYPPLETSTGLLNEAPTAAISAAITTGVSYPQGIALDSSGNIFVANCPPCYGGSGTPGVYVYPAGSNANTAPSAAIIGTSTGLEEPQGIALDSSGNIYVADDGDGACDGTASVYVYPPGSTANTAPKTTINGLGTGLCLPIGITLDSSRNIYVADAGNFVNGFAPSVYVYPAGSNHDAAPIATISGTSTGLVGPYGIAGDFSGNIYVADYFARSVFVYPPLGSLLSQPNYPNVAPIATISGVSTGLAEPAGIVVNSSGDIYVADSSAKSVFAYPPLGSSTRLPNESPTATISGPVTELGQPLFIGIPLVVGPTPTVSATPTPTVTPTATQTATATATNTATATASVTATATASATATATATPTATQTATATASATASSTATPTPTSTATATATVTPTSTQSATATPTATPMTVITTVPATMNFGIVYATGTSNVKRVALVNQGPTVATIESVTASPPFAVAGEDTCSGQSIGLKRKCSFYVEFLPVIPDAVTGGSIDVTYNGASPGLSLSGIGVEVTLNAPSKETFSPVAAGAAGKPKKIKISNPATVSVNLGPTSIGGNDPTAFTITANTCTRALPSKPSNCMITMEFTPKSGVVGAQSATVGFSYTYGANTSFVSIPISGTVK